jgi:HSP20 family protein
MGTQALVKTNGRNLPSVFDNFFKPWNEWFENDMLLGTTMNVPAVNITESKDKYAVSLAAPGLKKMILK